MFWSVASSTWMLLYATYWLYLRPLLFWDVRQHWQMVTDISGQPICSIWKGHAVQHSRIATMSFTFWLKAEVMHHCIWLEHLVEKLIVGCACGDGSECGNDICESDWIL